MPYLDPAHYELPFASSSDTSAAAAQKAGKFVGKQGMAVLACIKAMAAHAPA